jgi:hypothetical protein
MTNLEYINSLPCSQRLKDRIIELTKENVKKFGFPFNLRMKHTSRENLSALFSFDETSEGLEYWLKINESIINNTPIVE